MNSNTEETCPSTFSVFEVPSASSALLAAAASSEYRNTSLDKLAPRPKRRRHIQEEEEDRPASSSSSLTDGLYCVPVKEYQVSPGTSQAIRKVQEFEEDEYSV